MEDVTGFCAALKHAILLTNLLSRTWNTLRLGCRGTRQQHQPRQQKIGSTRPHRSHPAPFAGHDAFIRLSNFYLCLLLGCNQLCAHGAIDYRRVTMQARRLSPATRCITSSVKLQLGCVLPDGCTQLSSFYSTNSSGVAAKLYMKLQNHHCVLPMRVNRCSPVAGRRHIPSRRAGPGGGRSSSSAGHSSRHLAPGMKRVGATATTPVVGYMTSSAVYAHDIVFSMPCDRHVRVRPPALAHPVLSSPTRSRWSTTLCEADC